MTRPINILGIGTYVPRQVKRNSDFDFAAHGVNHESVARAGVETRRWASPRENIVDLAQQACLRALRCADLAPASIDRLIFITTTLRPDVVLPSGAAILQDKLGLTRCQSLTLTESSSGPIVAMELAASLLRSGQAKHVLVVAAETFSKTFSQDNPMDYEIGMTMGDGASAVVLSTQEGASEGLLACYTRSHPDLQTGIAMRPSSASADGLPSARIALRTGAAPPSYQGMPLIPPQMPEVMQAFVASTIPVAIREALTLAGLKQDKIDWFVLHQTGRMMLEAFKQASQIPQGKTVDTLARFGNLGSVSLLANLDFAFQTGKLKPGNTVLLAAAEEGATCGAMLWKWQVPLSQTHSYLVQEPEIELQEKLIRVDRYSIAELFERFIVPGAKPAYQAKELFADFIPCWAMFEGVSYDDAFEYLSVTENLQEWTLSVRNLHHLRDGIWAGEDHAAPGGKVFVRTHADKAARTIGWDCSHADPDDLWLWYRGLLIDGQGALGRPGTGFIWSNFVHERVKASPEYTAGFAYLFSAHSLEIRNLKAIVEHKFGRKP